MSDPKPIAVETVFTAPAFSGVRVMGFSFAGGDPDTMFVQMNAREPAAIDLHRLDLTTGEFTMIGKDPGRFVFWVPIPHGLRHAFIIDPGGDHIPAIPTSRRTMSICWRAPLSAASIRSGARYR